MGGWLLGKAQRSAPASNAIILAATSAATTSAFFLTRGRIAAAQRETAGAGAADPQQDRVKATVGGAAVAGAVFGAGAGRTPTAAGACLVGASVLGCTTEILRTQYTAWRLGKLLEERHPELFDTTTLPPAAADVAMDRPWYWPEWVPVQPTAIPTRESVLNAEIEQLRAAIAQVDNEIAAMALINQK